MGVVAYPWRRSETGHRPFGGHRATVQEHRTRDRGNTTPEAGGRLQTVRKHHVTDGDRGEHTTPQLVENY